MQNDGDKCRSTGCNCPCHKMLGLLIALIGVVFLLGTYDVISLKMVDTIWPILLIFIGLKKSCRSMCKCCSKASGEPN